MGVGTILQLGSFVLLGFAVKSVQPCRYGNARVEFWHGLAGLD